jgi:DNA-binding phage protein
LERSGGFDEENLVAELLADVIETDHWGLKAEIIAACLCHVARRGKLSVQMKIKR